MTTIPSNIQGGESEGTDNGTTKLIYKYSNNNTIGGSTNG